MDELLSEFYKNVAARYGILGFLGMASSGGVTHAFRPGAEILVSWLCYLIRLKKGVDVSKRSRKKFFDWILRMIALVVATISCVGLSAAFGVSKWEGLSVGPFAGIGSALAAGVWIKFAKKTGIGDSQDIESSSSNLTLSIPAVERESLPPPIVVAPADHERTTDPMKKNPGEE